MANNNDNNDWEEEKIFSNKGLTAVLGGTGVATAGFFTGYLQQIANYGFMGPNLEGTLAETGLISTNVPYGIEAVVENLGPIFSIGGGIAVGAGYGKEGAVALGIGAFASAGWSYVTTVAGGIATKYSFLYALSIALSNTMLGLIIGVPLGWLAKKIYKKLKGKKEE